LLQKDREYYLQRMFFDRVQELQYQQKVLHQLIDKNKDSSPDIVIRAVNVLHGITVSMNRLFQGLPVSTFYIPPTATAVIPFDSNVVQQRLELEQQIEKQPIFDVADVAHVGLDKHLQEEYEDKENAISERKNTNITDRRRPRL
jgi:hypothetical protein